MSKAGESIMRGLEEIQVQKKGELQLRTRLVTIETVPQYNASFVRELHLTQVGFAVFVGVSKKTMEAWEMSRNKPSGAACRLMEIVKRDQGIPE